MKFIRRKKKSNKPTPKMHVEVSPKKFIKPKEKMKSLFRLNTLVLISTLCIMIGLFCISYNYIQTKHELAFDTMNRKIKPKDIAKAEKKTEEPQPTQQPQAQPEQQETKYEYIGFLDIPAIKLSKGFLDRNSKYNNVDRNILVLKESDYPDVEKGNLIIAGHSGTGPKAFFKYLYKLKIGDIAKVTYKGYVYTYKIVNIEQQPKTGTITINRNYEKRTLTLITCTFENDTAQTIYLLENTKVEKEVS